jgi:peptide/nickel transport system permease protein
MRFSIRGSGTERPHPRGGGATADPEPNGAEADQTAAEPERGNEAGGSNGDSDRAALTTERAALEEIGPSLAEPEVGPEGGEVVSSGSPWVLVARTFAQNKLAIAGLVIIALMILFSFIAPLLYHTDQLNPNLANVNLAPGGGNPLGTDASGFDVLGRLMKGGQSSIEVGIAVGLVSTIFGLIYGAISGYFGGALDAILMRLIDIGLAIPIVFLFIFMAQIFKPSVVLLIFLLTLVSWLIPARLVRGETLSLRTREYVQAVQVMGGRSGRIILRHLIPNTIGVIMVTVTFQIANAILTLAVLQYLGFGLPPTNPTWGSMLSDGTTNLQNGYWWQVYPALIAIVITVVAFNFIGDALQDAFDVRLQEK